MVGKTGKEKLSVWWKGALAQGRTSVVVDWNRKTFSVMDGLAQGTVNVMVYVYALKIKEAILFSLENRIIYTRQ